MLPKVLYAFLEVAVGFLRVVLECCPDRFGTPNRSRATEPVFCTGNNLATILQMLGGFLRLPSVELEQYSLGAQVRFPI